MLWHVHDGGKTRRLSRLAILNGLDTGSIQREALVWTEGMPDWRPALQEFDIENLKIEASPPPSVRAQKKPASIPILLLGILAAAGVSTFGTIQDVALFEA